MLSVSTESLKQNPKKTTPWHARLQNSVLLVGTAICAVSAQAAEVTVTKKAAIMTPIENMYGRVEVRQTSMRWMNADGKVDNDVTSYRLIPRLGTYRADEGRAFPWRSPKSKMYAIC